jgi:hypothetical protein
MSWCVSALFYVSLWFGFVDTFEITPPVPFRTVMADNDPAWPPDSPRKRGDNAACFGFNPDSRCARPELRDAG